MNTRILIAVVVLMFVCQQMYAHDENDLVMPEATELEGTWEVVSRLFAGEQDLNDNLDDLLWRFEGNRTYYRMGDDEDWERSETFTVDPSATL